MSLTQCSAIVAAVLGMIYPEIYEMQAKAIFYAVAKLS